MARRRKSSLARRASRAIDGVVGMFSEKARYNRVVARSAADLVEKRSRLAYEGADKGHMHEDWKGAHGDADSELDYDTLDELRARSRERCQNTGLANTIITSVQENVVGHGLKPRLKLDHERLGISRGQADDMRGAHRELWDEWAPHADSRNSMHLADLQALALSSVLVNGDVGAMPIAVDEPSSQSPLSLKVDLIEADRILTPDGIADTESDGKRVVNGVVLGKRRQPIAYYVSKHHPGDELFGGDRGQFRRVKARNDDGSPRLMLLKNHASGRVGQTRGEPLFAPVLSAFKNLTDWEDAELTKAQVAACFAVFITKSSPYEAMIQASNGESTPGGKRAEEVVPGQIYYGSAGEEVKGVDSNSPPTEFEKFYTAVARQVCSVSGMPLEVAMRDFSNTTYSQARAALLEARRSFQSRQQWLVRYFLQPIHDRFLLEAWARGLYAATDFTTRRALWSSVTWQTPGWGHIDEAKSMAAAEKALAMRVTTRGRIAAQLHGEDIEDIERDLQREEETAAVSAVPHADADEEVEEEAETDDDTEKEEDDATEIETGSKVSDVAAVKAKADAYGVATRSGAITPQPDDEQSFREDLGLPAMSQEVESAWEQEGGVRRPVTLASPADTPADQPTDDDTETGNNKDAEEEATQDDE